LICGDTLITSRYTYYNNLESDIEDNIFNLSERNGDIPNTPNILINLDIIDPRFRNLLENLFFFQKPLLRPIFFCLTTSNSTDHIKDLLDLETQVQKYCRISANIKTTNKSTSKL
jgi:hypothetical protein